MTAKDDLLARMERSWSDLRAAADELQTQARMDVDLGNDWRVRDVLAHLALWERVAAWKLSGSAVPGSEGLVDDPFDLDSFNEGMRERWRERAVDDVLAELDAAHAALVAVVGGVDDESCAEGGRVWTVIDEDGAGHYEAHIAELRGALAG